MNYHRLLNLVISLGSILLENGAETYRVEESILHIMEGYGVENAEVFVIPSMLIVTIRPHDTEKVFTQQKRIRSRGTDLTKITDANDLVRRISHEQMELDKLECEIAAIRKGPVYSSAALYFAHAITGAGFSLFFGGSMIDAFFALFSGALVKFIFDQMGKLGTNSFFTNILASAALTAVAGFASVSPLHANMDTTIIGPMMLLVPGMALTTCMRDVIAGDYISSLVKLLEVLIIGLGIALGAYLAMSAMNLFI